MTNMDQVVDDSTITFEDVNDFCRHYWDEVTRIAQQVYRERGVSEPDDIEQSIWEAVVKYFDRSFKGVERDEVLARFRRAGRNYVWREAQDTMHFRGNYIYTPEAVRAILENQALPGEDQFDHIVGTLDVEGALEKLTSKRREAVRKHFTEGVSTLSMSAAEKRNLYRGIDDITLHLNRDAKVLALRLDTMETTERENLLSVSD